MDTITNLGLVCAVSLLFSFFIMLLMANLVTIARRAMKDE